MQHQRTASRIGTALLACVVFLALAIPASADTVYSEHASDHAATPALPQVGDRPAERAPAGPAPAASSSSSASDDGADTTAIVGLSLASIALLGFTATTLRRRRRVVPSH
jgi:hypothetical protein